MRAPLLAPLIAVLAACPATGPPGTLADLSRELREAYPDVPRVAPEELAAWLDDPGREPPLLLDARTPAEFAVSHLPGAVLAPSAGDVLPTLRGADPDRPIVVYCAVGVRSARLARALREAGLRNVSDLEGSIFRWAAEGREVVRDGVPVREVHPYDEEWGRLLPRELWSLSPSPAE